MPYKDPVKQREYRRQYYKKYYLNNPDKKERIAEKARERALKYYADNSDAVKLKARMYHGTHRRMYTENSGVWACYKCKATWDDGVQLDIHHKNQDNSDNSFDNLVCLCKRCHDGLHTKWQNEVIQDLIRDGVVDWTGEYNGYNGYIGPNKGV